jgi:hypothetical protein
MPTQVRSRPLTLLESVVCDRDDRGGVGRDPAAREFDVERAAPNTNASAAYRAPHHRTRTPHRWSVDAITQADMAVRHVARKPGEITLGSTGSLIGPVRNVPVIT